MEKKEAQENLIRNGKASENPYVVAVNSLGFYCIPRQFRERVVPKILLSGDVYEPRTLELIRNYVRDGDIVSGGAFIGDFLPALSRSVAPGRLVWTFEPHPVSYQAAKITVELNKLENVRLGNVAVGDVNGKLQLRVRNPRSGETAAASRIALNASKGSDGTVEVDVTTLDEMVPPDRKITIFHLDIEGFEHRAMLGARRIIETWRPLIILENLRDSCHRQWLGKNFPNTPYIATVAMERNCFFLPKV